MFDLGAAVGSDVDGLPLGLDALQRVEDAPPQLFVRADELHPEVIKLPFEVGCLSAGIAARARLQNRT